MSGVVPGALQADLFGEGAGPVGAAEPSPEHRRLARALPGGVRLGTSSWSFPGWAGIVYDRAAPQPELARFGLPAYALHPLLRTVGVDRAYYRSLDEEDWRRYAAMVPGGFRFVVKAERRLCLPEDAVFLDAAWAEEVVLGPLRAGLGDRAGPVILQFPPMAPPAVGGPRRFAERLYRFLDELPDGPALAVEIRTPELLTADYAAALRHAGAVHGYVVHPRSAPLADQLALVPPGGGRPLVVRWMLRAGLGYEQARDLYRPFDRLAAPDPASRGAIAEALRRAVADGGDGWVVVNNKAEGSAPLSVFRLAEEIASGAARGSPGG